MSIPEQISGISLGSAYIRPGTVGPITSVTYIAGGWITVDSKANLDAIDQSRTSTGQLAFVSESQQFYIATKIPADFEITFDDTVSWSEFTFSGSFSGSFSGDGSGLTGIASSLYLSGSTGNDTLNLKTDALTLTGSAQGIVVAVTDNKATFSISNTAVITGSFKGDGSGLTGVGGVPGGTNGQVQYNSASVFEGAEIYYTSAGSVGLGITNPSARLVVAGDAVITGKITAEEFHTEFVSASIIYQSGSTKFGNSADDNHMFTGTVNITGSVIAPRFSGSFSGSFQGDGSQLTGIASTLALSGSTGNDIINLKTEALTLTGPTNNIGVTVASNTATIAVSNNLTLSNVNLTGSFTGNFSGSVTAVITNAISASYALNAISASYALTSSYALTATSASHALQSNNAITASYSLTAGNAISASYSTTASYVPGYVRDSGGQIDEVAIWNSTDQISGSQGFFVSRSFGGNIATFLDGYYYSQNDGSFIAQGVADDSGSKPVVGIYNDTGGGKGVFYAESGSGVTTGAIQIANSQLMNAYAIGTGISPNKANTLRIQPAVEFLTGASGSFSGSFYGQFVGLIDSASYAVYAVNAATASYVLNAVSASYATTASYAFNAVSASYATTSSYSFNAVTSSYALTATTASYALTAGSALTATSASFATNANTATSASHAIFANTAGTAITATSASFATFASTAGAATSASFATNANTATSASHALYANAAGTATLATTATTALTASSADSFTVRNSATIVGDLVVGGKVTAEEFHTEFVSASIIFQSGSTIFGNSSDDTHLFTGSVSISHQLYAGLDSEVRPQVVGYNTATGELTYFNSSSILATAIPGGSDNQVQYNDNGTMAGASGFVWTGTSVGIGTASPGYKLEVDGTQRVSGNFYLYNTVTNVASNFTNQRGLGFDASTGATEIAASTVALQLSRFSTTGDVLAIRHSGSVVSSLGTDGGASFTGNVGVGTSSPAVKLHVYDTTQGRIAIETSGSRRFDIVGDGDGLVFRDQSASANRITLSTAGALKLHTYGSGTNTGTATKTLAVDSSGNVIELDVSSNGTGVGNEVAVWKDTDTVSGSQALTWNGTVLAINGTLEANEKSFVIDHPTLPGKKLVYGVLEGPEHAVYCRGKISGEVIQLPEEWTGLVDQESITVQLTPIGKHQNLYVVDIKDNKVFIKNGDLLTSKISAYYYIQATRKDVKPLQTVRDK